MSSLNPAGPVRLAVTPVTLNLAANHLDTLTDYLNRVASHLASARAELTRNWLSIFQHSGPTTQSLRTELDRAAAHLRTAQRLNTHYELASRLRVISADYTSSEEQLRAQVNTVNSIGSAALLIGSLGLGPGGVLLSGGALAIKSVLTNDPHQPIPLTAVRAIRSGHLDATDKESWMQFLSSQGSVQLAAGSLGSVLVNNPVGNNISAIAAMASGNPIGPTGLARTAQTLNLAQQIVNRNGPYPISAGVTVEPVGQWQDHEGAGSLSELIGDIGGLDPGRSQEYGLIEIRQHTSAEGVQRWTVLIPGTQEQSIGTTRRAWDNASNLALATGDIRASSAQVVLAAMDQAGIQPSDPVMLVGHSQGGLVAASLGVSALVADRFNVSSVVTVGAPVGALVVGREVPQLHLEHDTDSILAFDGRDNPVLPERVTVERLLIDSDLEVDRKPHSTSSYQVTAELFTGSGHPEAAQWVADHSWAFNAGGETQMLRYQGSR